MPREKITKSVSYSYRTTGVMVPFEELKDIVESIVCELAANEGGTPAVQIDQSRSQENIYTTIKARVDYL